MRSYLAPLAWSAVTTAALFLGSSCSSDDEAQRTPRQVTQASAELADAVDGNSAFAWSLYDQLRSEPGNLFLSPFSISAGLGMTSAGAAHATAAQMKEALRIKDAATYHPAFGSLLLDLSGEKSGRGYQLFIANRLFSQSGFELAQPFLDTTQQNYGAGLDPLDFVADAEGARQHINAWVAEQTKDRIAELLEPGAIDGLTRLVLANAIYFQAEWARRLDVVLDFPFFLRDGSHVNVQTMRQDGYHMTSRGPLVDVVELDYRDREIAMVILVPAEGVDFDVMEDEVVSAGIGTLVAGMSEAELTVLLPKFEFKSEVPLRPALEALGMADAFQPGAADFSAMSPSEPLYLHDVRHEAYVKVDEEGTEAAAATESGVQAVAAPPSLWVNKPFLFVIRDKLTGSLLFLGRVEDPRAS